MAPITKYKKLFLLFFAFTFGSLNFIVAQQCTLLYLNDLDPNSEEGYQFSEGWRLQNVSSSCNANNYYLTPQSAQISYDNGTTWQQFSGMNLEFYRTTGPNQINTLQSDRFSISSFSIDDVNVWFNVSPSISEVYYRIFFDIHDSNNQPLNPLPGGRLFTDIYYPQPKPDLVVKNASISPSSINIGGTITVDCTVKNVGFATSIPSRLKTYYSSNSGFSTSSDIELDDIIVSSLDPGQSLSYSYTVTIPQSAAEGNRYIILYADALDFVDEINEGSANRVTLPVQVSNSATNDFYISNVSISPNPIGWNQTLEINFDQVYQGNQYNLPSVTAAAFVSSDCILDGGDQLVGTANSILDAGDTFDPELIDFIVGTGFPVGTNYIILVADYDGEVSEDDEGNNNFCIPFEISGSVNYYTNNENISHTTVQAGTEVTVSCSIQGNGIDRVYIGYILSTDCDYDPSIDVYLDNDNHNFNVSSINSESENLEIPAGTPAGTYRILIVTDYEEEIAETNETDNIHCFTITVTNSCTSPVADFTTNLMEATVNQPLVVSNNSVNVDFWTWTFSGASPSSYTDPNPPTINFNEPGIQTISLEVSNACGTDIISQNIKVKPDISLPPPAFYTESNPSSVGDPIDASTGAYLWAQEDMSLGGINGNYAWRRFYNSQLNYNGDLGWNWTHTYDIALEINGSYWTVKHGNGQKTYFVGYSDGSSLPMYEGTLDTIYYESGSSTYIYEKPNGVIYTFESDGDILSINNRNNNTVSFSYTGNQLDQISIPGGRFYTLSYLNGRIATITDNAGRAVTYNYDASGDLTSSVNVRGGTTTFVYDNNHQILSISDPNNNTFVQNTYDGGGRIISQLDVFNNISTLNYDTPVSGATTITNPLGGAQVHYHNSKFQLTQFVNELNDNIILGYENEVGKIKSFNDEKGNSTFFDYDNFGNLILIQDPLGHQTNITFNFLNLPVSITNALGNITSITYDATGNPLSVTLPNGGIYNATFNSNGQLLTQTTPNGQITTYQYNNFGDVTTISTPTGNYLFTYDDIGRITSVVDRNGNSTQFSLDPAGNITQITDQLGYTVDLIYDANGNITSYQDKEDNTSSFVYDGRDQLIEVTDPLNYSTFFNYDQLGRLIAITGANSNVVDYVYDNKGQVIQYIDSLGTYEFNYDANGNIIEIVDALNNTTSIGYDNGNQPIFISDPLGNTSNFAYDAIGQLVSQTDANNNQTQFTFNNMGWLTSVTDAIGGISSYSYDLEGNLTSYTDANGYQTNYTYNSLNLPVNRTYPGNFTASFSYDNEGNILSKTDENGVTANFIYNGNYNVTNINYSNGAAYQFTYDKESRLLSMANGNGLTSMQRDARGYLTQITDPFGNNIQYNYDGEGNRVGITYPGGNTVSTQYNAVNLPIQIIDWLGNYSQRTYDANSQLIGITNSNGTYTNVIRDELGRVASYKNHLPDASEISSHTLSYDPAGNITAIQQNLILEPNYFAASETLSYGNDDRLMISGGDTFTNDNNGARSSVSGNLIENYSWVEEDLLVSYTRNGVITQNYFNPLRQRIQKDKGTEITKYVLDFSGNLSTVLQERDGSNQLKNHYIYAPDGLNWKLDNNNNPQFYHFDFIGHTIALSDNNGTLTDAYATDAFGDFLAHNGMSEQPFIFLGKYGVEYEGTGHYHIRAREYDATLGRFFSKDVYPFSVHSTQTINRYTYSLNHPHNYIDINGLYTQEIVHSHNYFERIEYDFVNDNFFDRYYKLNHNAGVGLINDGIAIYNYAEDVYSQGSLYAGGKKVINDGGQVIQNVYDYAVNTSTSEFREDVNHAFNQPETYEGILGTVASLGAGGVVATKKISTQVLKPLGRGSTGRIVARNLKERLVMDDIVNNPTWGNAISNMAPLSDPRWKGWRKMEYRDAGVVIHYNALMKNGNIIAIDDFKFKN